MRRQLQSRPILLFAGYSHFSDPSFFQLMSSSTIVLKVVYSSCIVYSTPETDHELWLSGLEKSVNDFNLTLLILGFVSLDSLSIYLFSECSYYVDILSFVLWTPGGNIRSVLNFCSINSVCV